MCGNRRIPAENYLLGAGAGQCMPSALSTSHKSTTRYAAFPQSTMFPTADNEELPPSNGTSLTPAMNIITTILIFLCCLVFEFEARMGQADESG